MANWKKTIRQKNSRSAVPSVGQGCFRLVEDGPISKMRAMEKKMQSTDKTGQYATSAELAVYLGVSVRTIQRMTRSGALPSFRIGGARLYAWADLSEAAGITLDPATPLLNYEQTVSEMGSLSESELADLVSKGLIRGVAPFGLDRILRSDLGRMAEAAEGLDAPNGRPTAKRPIAA